MKITKRQLRKIIKEEYRRILNENEQPVYDWDAGGIYDMLDYVEGDLYSEADSAAKSWMMHIGHRKEENPGKIPKEYYQQGGTVRKIAELYYQIAQDFIDSGETDESANKLYDAFLSKDSPENFDAFLKRIGVDISSDNVDGYLPLSHLIWHVINKSWENPL